MGIPKEESRMSREAKIMITKESKGLAEQRHKAWNLNFKVEGNPCVG